MLAFIVRKCEVMIMKLKDNDDGGDGGRGSGGGADGSRSDRNRPMSAEGDRTDC